MLTLKSIRDVVYRLKKYQKPMEKWIFPVILLLYPLIGVSQGVDITDTTYSLGNYEYAGVLDPMWMIATYIPNVLGRLFMALPGGASMLGMNVYCSFIISATALSAYYMLQRWIPGWMVFLGEMISVSLCWCPRVILYNYLTYLLFSLGVLFLLHAMTDYELTGWKFILAGLFLGLSVMTRFPNIIEALLIVVLWYYEGLHKRDIGEIVGKTGFCILGYAIGFAVPLIAICLQYGVSSYPEMIMSLSSMSEGASDYSALGMLGAILAAWYSSLQNMIILLPCMFVGVIMLMLKPGKYYWIKRILYVGGILVLIRYYFMRGVFTRSYFYYDSMFEAAMMFLIWGLCFLVVGCTPLIRGQASERSLCLTALLIMIITPIGSNNYTYPLLNNLFIVAPIILWLFRRIRQAAGPNELNFTWKATFMATLLVLCVQGGLFHMYHSFVDGTDGTPRSVLVGSQDIPRAAGMHTTEWNAQTVSEVYRTLDAEGLLDCKLLQFGKAPGASYLFGMEPAIFTTWPDLDSNTTEKFRAALTELPGEDGELPVVLVNPDFEGEVLAEGKYELLLDFLDTWKYNKIFDNGRFEIYAVK